MFNQSLDPVDTCACGDTGYLTTRTVPIDLAHGVGYIEKVPVYHCQSSECHEYTLPSVVSHRLEDIAEHMEETSLTNAIFTWVSTQDDSLSSQSIPSLGSLEEVQVQAFTLQFLNRKYEDAQVVLVVPGQAIFLKSTVEDAEYYLLRYEAESTAEGIWFSLHKFYYEETEFTYEDFLAWSEDGYLKEIGRLTLEEVEDALTDEFGEDVALSSLG